MRRLAFLQRERYLKRKMANGLPVRLACVALLLTCGVAGPILRLVSSVSDQSPPYVRRLMSERHAFEELL